MIKIVVDCIVKNSKLKEFKDITSKMVDETRKNDRGNIKYELFERDLSIDLFKKETIAANTTVFAFIEEWESLEALQEHMNSRHLIELSPQLETCLAQESIVKTYRLIK